MCRVGNDQEALARSPSLTKIKRIADACGYDVTRFLDLYGVLSEDHHGTAWSAAGIRLHAKSLPDEPTRCLIQSLLESNGLKVERFGDDD